MRKCFLNRNCIVIGFIKNTLYCWCRVKLAIDGYLRIQQKGKLYGFYNKEIEKIELCENEIDEIKKELEAKEKVLEELKVNKPKYEEEISKLKEIKASFEELESNEAIEG